MKISKLLMILIYLGVFLTSKGQQPFTAGNIVVYRVGDGSSPLNFNASKVFLDEYTPSGTPVQSIQMPATGQKLTMPGSDPNFYFHGLMTLSANGKYLVVPAFNSDLGDDPYNGTMERSIGLVDFNGTVSSITALANSNQDDITSAVSDNGTNLWLAGINGVEYCQVGAVSSTKITTGSVFSVGLNITGGKLYVSNRSGAIKIATVGTGLPVTTGQAETGLPGIPAAASPFQFAFADLDTNVPGVDVLYVTDQNSAGIRKYSYSLTNSTWEPNGAIGTVAERYTGLTTKVTGNIVTVFATRQGSNSSSVRGGELVSLTDNSGYNGMLTGTPTVIASVATPNTKAFRGVARVPLNCSGVTGLQVTNVTATQATISWNPVTGGTNYEYAVTLTPTPPASGTATTNISEPVSNLSNGLTYYVHVRTICNTLGGSEWLTSEFITSCKPPAAILLTVSISGTGIATIKWNQVFGAASYEYFISNSPTSPVSGTNVTDTSISVANLNPVTEYYIHVRSDCGSGAFSTWVNKKFTTTCFMPVINVSLLPNHAGATWNRINNAIKYEYALTHTAAKPLSGAYTTDTFYIMDKLRDGSGYYFHVRSICGTGTVSDWSTIDFQIQGLQAYPNPMKESITIRLNGFGNSNGKISIADATGRVIKQIQLNGNSTTINTKDWSMGVYLIRYDDGKNRYTVMVMKR
jgi:hypothetical protein